MAAITLPPNRTCKFPRIRLSRTVNKFINLSLSLSSLVRRIYLRELCLRTETTLRTEQRGIVLRLILLITLIKVDLSPYGGVSVRIDVSPTEWCISIFYVVPHIKQGLSSILVFFFFKLWYVTSSGSSALGPTRPRGGRSVEYLLGSFHLLISIYFVFKYSAVKFVGRSNFIVLVDLSVFKITVIGFPYLLNTLLNDSLCFAAIV